MRKYDRNGNLLWTRQFGSDKRDYATAVGVDADQNVILAGYTEGVLAQSSAGGFDAFVRKYDRNGDLLWTPQFGSALSDTARSVSVDAYRNVLVQATPPAACRSRARRAGLTLSLPSSRRPDVGLRPRRRAMPSVA